MKSYSILSPNDGQLLIRMHDELVKGGMKSRETWNLKRNPTYLNHRAEIKNRSVFYYCLYVGADKIMEYHNFDARLNEPDDPELIHLTPENFDEVLKKVIENSWKLTPMQL